MNKNYEKCANKTFVIAFFICLLVFAFAQIDRAIFISWSLLKPKNTTLINQYFPSSLQIRPSLAHAGQEIEYTKIRDVLEYRATNGIPALDKFVKSASVTNSALLTVNAQFQRLLGKHTVRQKLTSTLFSTGNHTTNIDHNILNYKNYYAKTNADPYIDYLKYFTKEMHKNSIEVLYLRRPEKIEHINYSQRTQSLIKKPTLSGLVYEGINGHMDRIDLMDLWDNKWGEPYELFFKTDHHWQQLGAFRLFQSISKILENKYNIEINKEYLKLDNYDQIVLPRAFLGSTGRFVGYAGGELDDFLLLSPLFPTYLDVKRSSAETSGVGVFDQVFYDTTYLPPAHYYFKGNIYGTFNYQEHALIQINNKMNNNGKKIVMLNDSFSSSIAPFFSLFVDELHMIDTRLYNGNVIDYIARVQPDLVIIMNLPHMLSQQLKVSRKDDEHLARE